MWEDTDRDESDDDSDTYNDDPQTNPEAAALCLLDLLLSLYYQSSMSAATFCAICYWVGLCGVQSVAKFGKAPGAPSGHYQRFLDSKLELGPVKDNLYTVTAPGHHLHSLSREQVPIYTQPAHEALDDELRSDPTISVRIREAIDLGKLPPCYHEHTVTRACDPENPPVPCALYMDGIAYSLLDSAVGIWLINLITQKRHHMGII